MYKVLNISYYGLSHVSVIDWILCNLFTHVLHEHEVSEYTVRAVKAVLTSGLLGVATPYI